MDKNWKYFKPKFEYEEKFQDVGWPWAGHKFFVYDLVRSVKPERIVELGTHKGTSLFSMCQAIKDEKLDTEISAVDTWKGDKHAGFYGDDIFQGVEEIKNKYYSDLEINLIRKTFDEAVADFANNSIDMLHIDGLHTYEAVKHDFESWLPKVKNTGTILFHDIKVGEKDFGVHELWNELRKKYQTIEFHQSFGLGILFLNEAVGKVIKNKEKYLQMHYSYIYEIKKSESVHRANQVVQQKDREMSNLNIIVHQKDQEINNLNQVVQQKDQEIAQKDQEIAQKDQEIAQKGREIMQKYQEIRQKNQEIDFIKTSKFWKLRNIFISIKKFFHL